jgi:hypothetical protein
VTKSDPPRKLREFLYVDIQRTRSLLAQLDEGVAESAAKKYTFDDTMNLGPKLLKTKFATGEEYQESKSLQDLVFCVFEDGAEAEGLLADLPDTFHDPETWTTGEAQASLREGQLLRVSAPIQIVDPSFVSARLARFTQFATAVVNMNIAAPLEALRAELDAAVEQAPNKETRRRLERQRESQLREAPQQLRAAASAAVMGGASPETVTGVADFLSAFLGDTIAVRVLAGGPDHPSASFGGVLLSRDEYLQKEREALFSRYGQPLEGWTIVMQIARIPPAVDPHEELEFDDLSMVNDRGQADRTAVETAATRLLSFFESSGLAEGPRWPSITMTPLAIYRVVPQPAIL